MNSPRKPRAQVPGMTQPMTHRSETMLERGGESAIPKADDTRVARHLLGLTLIVSATLGLMGVVLVQLILAVVSQSPRPGRVLAPAERGRGMCTLGSTTDCEIGEVCDNGRCVAARRATDCEVGDPCNAQGATCTCGGDLTCEMGVCRAPTKVAGVCSAPEVQEILRELAETCKGDVQGCPDEKLEQFALASKNFDGVLANFPNTMTIHFPDGQPAVDVDWPIDPMRRYYRERLGQKFMVEALQEATQVLLIGRSSEGGTPAENHKFSRRRLDTVIDLLAENARTPKAEAELRRKIKTLRLGNKKTLEIEFFQEHVPDRMIAWSSEEEQTLRENVKDDDLRGQTRNKTRRLLNQVVFLVPLPCTLPASK